MMASWNSMAWSRSGCTRANRIEVYSDRKARSTRPEVFRVASSCLLRECPRRERRAGGHEHVLAAVEHVRRRGRAVHGGAHLISPQQFASARVEGEQVALGIAAEDQARCRGQQARGRRGQIAELPL